MIARLSSSAARRWLVGLALLATGALAAAQQDPPGIVARLNFHQGTVSFSPAGDDSWYDAAPNRPITTGDRLWTDRGARAEVFVGSTAVRLDGQTSLEFTEIADDTVRLTVQTGNVQVRVRDELAGQRLEIDTDNMAFVIDRVGEYRIESDQQNDTTRLAVLSGNGTAYGESGSALPLGARQQLAVSGRNLQAAGGPPMQVADAFDRWVDERNRLEDQSVSARYVSRGVVGYQQLDQYGDWQNDAEYGNVWYPRSVSPDWAPYQDGQWVNVAPWGWTWVDAAPWGFAPFHYGRWARVGPRWGWVPGRTQHARPVYSPALVGFVGGSAGASISLGGGRNGVGWFPLAPNEEWRPGYRASRRYIDEANRMGFSSNRSGAQRNDFYAHQRVPNAVTVVPQDRFGRGGPFGQRDLIRMPDDRFARAPIAFAPPVAVPQQGPGRQGAFGGWGARPAAAMPPAAFQARQQQVPSFQQPRDAAARMQQEQVQRQQQDAIRQQQEAQQRGGRFAPQLQQQQEAPAFQQPRDAAARMQQEQLQRQQQEAMRQQQEAQQRGGRFQQEQIVRQQEAQQRASQQQGTLYQQPQWQQQQQLQQQNAVRQQQEGQQRAAQQQQQAAQQQQMQQQRLQQQQQQAMQQQQAAQQQQAMRQAQEQQQRAAQQQMQQAQQQQQMQQQMAARQQQQQMQQQQAQQQQQQAMQAQQQARQAQQQQAQQAQQAAQQQQQQRMQRSGTLRGPNEPP